MQISHLSKIGQMVLHLFLIKKDQAECIICPPALYVDALRQALPGDIAVGGQNVSDEDSGAFTGEVSVKMLKDVGASYVIIGHSERRAIYGETNDFIAKKVSKAMEEGLTPILCIGETLDEKPNVETVLAKQLDESIPQGVDLAKLIIAYEPVWAIGTGEVASLEDIETTHKFIKEHLQKTQGGTVPLLYGGSVKPGNAADILNTVNVDGVFGWRCQPETR